MRIINIMLGKKRGGLEQAAIDYAEALKLAGIDTLNVVAPGGWVAEELRRLDLPFVALRQHGGWDLLAAKRLAGIARRAQAGAILCHGNRALSLALLSKSQAKIIAVAHNFRTRRFGGADAVFAITRQAQEALEHDGIEAEKIFWMPNMVRASAAAPRRQFRNPPVIGSLGRFARVKGFEMLIDALGILHSQGVAFQATIGGGGDEENFLRQRIALARLQSVISLPGWVDDKESWFSGVDIFALPSHHEPFGIVLIEAMEAALPIAATDTIGPREILEANATGLLSPVGNAEALAANLLQLLNDPAQARRMGAQAQARVREHYSPSAMAGRLRASIDAILTGN